MRKKTNKKGLIAALLCAMLVTAIGGFAWLTASDIADSTHTITAGEFAIEFTDEANAISRLIDLPKTRAEGLATTPAEFTVHNDGDIAQSVKLQAENVGVAGNDVYGDPDDADPEKAAAAIPVAKRMQIDASLINVEIFEAGDDPTSDSPYWAGTLAQLSVDSKGVTSMFNLAGDGEKAFELYAWINDSAQNADIYGATGDKIGSIKFQIAAYGVQRDGGLGASDANWATDIAGLFS